MKVFSIDDLSCRLDLGRQTEHGVREVRVECRAWLRKWPGLTISAWVTPPGGAAAYPAATHMEGTVLVWPIAAGDTATAGIGSVEFMGSADGQKKLSAIFETLIRRTTTGATSDPPAPAQPWVDEVLDAAQRAEGAAETAEAAAVHPPVIGDAGTWLLWDAERGAYVDTGLPSKGEVVEPVYELIETITMAEAAALKRTAEPDATPYAFKALFATVNTNGSAYSGSLYVYSNGQPVGTGYYGATTAKTKFALEVVPDRGFWKSYIHAATSSGVRYDPMSIAHTYLLSHKVEQYPVIDQLDSGPTVIPAGSVIQIWGVRA